MSLLSAIFGQPAQPVRLSFTDLTAPVRELLTSTFNVLRQRGTAAEHAAPHDFSNRQSLHMVWAGKKENDPYAHTARFHSHHYEQESFLSRRSETVPGRGERLQITMGETVTPDKGTPLTQTALALQLLQEGSTLHVEKFRIGGKSYQPDSAELGRTLAVVQECIEHSYTGRHFDPLDHLKQVLGDHGGVNRQLDHMMAQRRRHLAASPG